MEKPSHVRCFSLIPSVEVRHEGHLFLVAHEVDIYIKRDSIGRAINEDRVSTGTVKVAWVDPKSTNPNYWYGAPHFRIGPQEKRDEMIKEISLEL